MSYVLQQEVKYKFMYDRWEKNEMCIEFRERVVDVLQQKLSLNLSNKFFS